MAPLFASDPSPLVQTAVYMAAMLTGYALLTPPEEWSRAWQTVRTVWSRRRG
jgi:hypothetical protein